MQPHIKHTALRRLFKVAQILLEARNQQNDATHLADTSKQDDAKTKGENADGKKA